ncbi:MAG TPA: glycosyltransferase family 4 protein [Candidatus Binataceae bacterium]|nr:glycosyltransferase family 4 protein [Candidatus Binataceae bacterium]
MIWQILTGEYPPDRGGVSDYTRCVARGLAAAGDEVHVWAPPSTGLPSEDAGVVLHRLPDRFGPLTLPRLGAMIARAGGGRLLVQYEPQAFGWRGMNVALCAWLAARRGRGEPTVMCHEVMFPISREQPWSQNLRGVVNRIMAAIVVRSAARIFVSTPYWAEVLRRQVGVVRDAVWLPLPSTIPALHDEAAVLGLRRSLIPAGGSLLGHFSTYPGTTRRLLAEVLPRILDARKNLEVVLMGAGSREFRATLGKLPRELPGRIHATGYLPAADASAHLSGCDLMLQPYADGACARRTTLVAALAHGRPIVSNRGSATESLWQQTAALALVDDEAAALADRLLELLDDPAAQARYGASAAALYRTRFALEHTIGPLRAELWGSL